MPFASTDMEVFSDMTDEAEPTGARLESGEIEVGMS